ncbi:MAG: HAMP domain-containing histidine kinase [Bacteroidales bacterium]|jgi:signal transduction histidine kinase|nr:HAMP domain-containing histidine kinase [Bacteroidales bacterium]
MKKRFLATIIIILVLLLQIIWLVQYYKLEVDIYCEDFEKNIFNCNVELFTQDIIYKSGEEEKENTSFQNRRMSPEMIKALHSGDSKLDLSEIITINQYDPITGDTIIINNTLEQYLITGFAKRLQKEWNEKISIFPASEQDFRMVKKGYYYSSVIQIIYPFNIQVQAKVKIPVRKIILNMLPIIVIALLIVIVFVGTYQILNKLYLEQKIINEQKDIFINQMSHDFRLPLAVIKSVLNNIEIKYNEDEDTMRVTNLCHNTLNNLDEMINSVLTMSSINKKIEVNQVLTGNEIIEIINKVNKEIFVHKNIKIEIYSSIVDNNKISGNALLLRQVFVNMFNNSVIYCEKDPLIKVSISSLEKGIEVSISDNGIGIPDEDKEHIFEDFYRVTTFSTVNGTGLGLFIAKEFIKIMKGNLKLKSSSPEGSTFVVYLPYIN